MYRKNAYKTEFVSGLYYFVDFVWAQIKHATMEIADNQNNINGRKRKITSTMIKP